MAVPKQRQSHARTNKRRSQHKIVPPSLSTCSKCGAPRRPHRACGECGAYGDRQVFVPTVETGDDE
jgi:large subunit ribosomal protein L32